MNREDVDMHQTAELQPQLQLESEVPGVRWGQDFSVLSSLEVDMVLNGDVDPIVPSSNGDGGC